MPFLPAVLASAAYLLPVALVVGARWRPDRSPRELAVDIPAAVALDLLIILALARAMRVDVAVVVSRALWAVAAVVVLAARWRRASPPAAAAGHRFPIAALAGGAGLALIASLLLSRPFAIWDRQWHIPLVTSLRGQQIPFGNVYQLGVPLGYHVSGDVLAAALQTLSGVRLHASAALSLAHDLMFALGGIVIAAALFRPGRGWRWQLFMAVAPIGVLLAGPLAVLGAFGFRLNNNGYSYLNYYELSYRPHVVLAGLLIAGIVSALTLELAPDERPRGFRWAMLPALALLSVTDEPAAVMLVPALALVAFLRRGTRARPWTWVAVAALYPATVGLALALFPSALIGGAHPALELVAPQLPSLHAPVLPLSTGSGLLALAADMAPMVACLILMAIVARGQRRREAVPVIALGVAVLVMACVLLTTVVAGKSPGESHRFMTLPMVAIPLLALHFAEWLGRRSGVALAVIIGAPVIGSAVWAIGLIPVLRSFAPDRYAPGIHQADCRAQTGATIGEPARPTYVPVPAFYAWSGCRPVRAPGHTLGTGQAGQFPDVGRPVDGPAGLNALAKRFLTAGEDLVVACPNDERGDDSVCRAATAAGACEPAGSDWRRCLVSPAARPRMGAALGVRL